MVECRNLTQQSGKRVLVVEDDPVHRKLAALRLAELGLEVTTASDGAEGLDRARAASPDVILCDVLMPRCDGFSLCQRVRDDPALAAVPVVLTSASFVDDDDRALARKLGATAYVTKAAGIDQEVDAVLHSLTAALPARRAAPGDAAEHHIARLLDQLDKQHARNTRLEQSCELRRAALGLGGTLAGEVAHQGDFRRALQDALASVTELFDACGGALYEYRPIAVEPTVVGGFPGAGDASLRALIGRVAGNPSRLDASAPDHGGGRLCAAPLWSGGDAIGVLVLAYPADRTVERDHLDVLELVAGQIAQAIALHRAFAAAVSSQQKLGSLLDTAHDGMFLLTRDGIIVEANRSAQRIHAHGRGEMIGRHFTELVAGHTVGRERARYEQMLDKGAVTANDVEIIDGMGGAKLVDIRACLVTVGDEQMVIAVEHDASERRKLEGELRQAQKLEAVGQLTGGIAHDFNNLLSVILTSAQFLNDSLGDEDPRREDAEEIQHAAERAAALTRRLLAFSRRQALTPANIDLNAVITGFQPMLRRLIGEDVELVLALAGEPWTARADVSQVEQVVLNLVVNARDAMPGGGTVTITTANVPRPGAPAPLSPGDYIAVSVRDTGCGMDADTQRRAFEPFFTTKEPGRGTGLGLSTCYGIVVECGGHITIESEPAHGALFTVYLPRVDADAIDLRRPAVARPERCIETILVVEDDDCVRRATTKVLAGCGYRVLAARDLAETSHIIDSWRGEIDLVVSDVVMPGASGPALTQLVTGRFPNARTLFMSGYTDHAMLRDGRIRNAASFLQKPFTPEALAAKVREVLAGQAARSDS